MNLKVEFTETRQVITKCPRCGGKLIRNIDKEPQQETVGRWYVEHCEDCGYWNSGFV